MKVPPLSLGRKLTLVILSFSALMLSVVFFSVISLGREYMQRVYSITGENTRNILSSVDSAFSGAMVIADLLSSDESLQRSLAMLKDGGNEASLEESRGRILARISSTPFSSSSFIVDISLLTGSGDIHYGSGLGLSPLAIEEASGMARESGGAAVWVGSDEGSIYLVRTIRRLEFLSLDELASLFIRIDAAGLVESIRAGMSNAGIGLALAYSGRLLYSDYPEGVLPPSLDAAVWEVDGVRCFVYRGTLPESGFSYVDLVPAESAFGSLLIRIAGTLLLLILIPSAYLLVLRFMLRRIIARVNALKGRMDAFENGSYKEGGTIGGHDEIADLNRRFDSMVKGYRKAENDSYNRLLMLKDSKIRMLTEQINPHFLYNVLDSIYWLSQKYQAEDIASMSCSLASLFRAAVSSEDIVPLSRELELVASFVSIQQTRFTGLIDYSADVPGFLMQTLVPKFSIQPLVENAVKHSVEELGVATTISVRCFNREESAVVEVSNTGSSFPEDIAAQIAEGRIRSLSGRIGLKNIDERLRLLFGEDKGLEFMNVEGAAIVSFTVPWRSDAQGNSGR